MVIEVHISSFWISFIFMFTMYCHVIVHYVFSELSFQCDVNQHDPHRSAGAQRGGLVQVSQFYLFIYSSLFITPLHSA